MNYLNGGKQSEGPYLAKMVERVEMTDEAEHLILWVAKQEDMKRERLQRYFPMLGKTLMR